MLTRLFLSALVVLSLVGTAQASTTYSFEVSGRSGISLGCGPFETECVPMDATSGQFWVGWGGVTVSGSGPGTYTGADVLSLWVDTLLPCGWMEFCNDVGEFGYTTDGRGGASVTIDHRQVIGIDDERSEAWVSPSFSSLTQWRIDGLSISLIYAVDVQEIVRGDTDARFKGRITAEGGLSPAPPLPVPEPSSYALMLVGLGLLLSAVHGTRRGALARLRTVNPTPACS